MQSISRRNTIPWLVAAITLTAALAIASPQEDVKKLPGYLDFGSLGLPEAEATVEVFLEGPVLAMAIRAIRHEEPELARSLDGIRLFQVRVHEIDGPSDKVKEKTTEVASQLEKKGWQRIVRVRERRDLVHIYSLPGEKDEIHGLVIMAIEDGDDAVFVNIAGTVSADDLGQLLDSIDHNVVEIGVGGALRDDFRRRRSHRQ